MDKPVPDITSDMLSEEDRERLNNLSILAARYCIMEGGTPWYDDAIQWAARLVNPGEDDE